METELLTEIDDFLRRSKRLRDKGLYEKAITLLEVRAAPLISGGLASANPSEKIELGRKLADCYGLQGGLWRRWALEAEEEEVRRYRLSRSVENYRLGEEVESDSTYGITSTYNLLNKVISQILLNPRALLGAGDGAVNARQELEKVEREMEQQKSRDDSWFLADKALVELLLDKNDVDPKDIYSSFINPNKTHPYFVYESMLSTLRPLSNLDLPVGPKLREAVRLLEARLQHLQQG